MAHYLFQVSYTPEAWAALLANPQDRTKPIDGVLHKLGGKLERAWLAFGDYDVVGVMDMPDDVSAAAFSIAVAAGGACRSVKTTPLVLKPLSVLPVSSCRSSAPDRGWAPAGAAGASMAVATAMVSAWCTGIVPSRERGCEASTRSDALRNGNGTMPSLAATLLLCRVLDC